MAALNDAGAVASQYRDETRLETRRAVWQPYAGTPGPHDLAADAVRATRPRRILEVGCGTGGFAQRLAAENPATAVVATDRSPRLVELAAKRGVDAAVADVQHLPFGDAELDVVVAMWMLYHVPDLDLALHEVRRVLRPGGVFVAVTNGEDHLAQLLAEAGGGPMITQFSSENGGEVLARHFDEVRRDDVATRAVFESHAEARAYLATFDEVLAERLPTYQGPREYAGATSVFRAVAGRLGAEAGCCSACVHAKLNETRRGTVYLRCTRAGWDDRLNRYPRLPVLHCVGFNPADPDDHGLNSNDPLRPAAEREPPVIRADLPVGLRRPSTSCATA
ncbi:MAG TPA: methyltransferase domain-containing protein [Nocardioidaceae bacterium]|nr:methyltransferase domain-containing protein [Nocardioidaceae bacterium]